MLEEQVFLPERSGVFYVDEDQEKEMSNGWFEVNRSFRDNFTRIKVGDKWYDILKKSVALMDEYPKLSRRIIRTCDEHYYRERPQGTCLIPSCKNKKDESSSVGVCEKHNSLLIEMAMREIVGVWYDAQIRERAYRNYATADILG